MRSIRWVFLTAALAVAIFQPSPRPSSAEGSRLPGDQGTGCVLLGCDCSVVMCCCSYECRPGGDVQDCWFV